MRRIGESIFLKLLLVFAFAGAADVVVMRVFQRHVVFNDERRMHRGQNMAEYAQFLISSLGPHPDAEKVTALAQRLHLQIRMESPEGVRISSPDVADFQSVESKISLRYADEMSKVGKYRDFMVIDISRPPSRYLFFLESEDALEGHSQLILGLMAVLLVILLITYLSIRRILGPLRALEKGVQEVSAGKLDVSISVARPVPSNDELGRLVKSFNKMTEQIRTMFLAKEQLLLDVSHEFRSPLTRIRVALELPGEDAKESIGRSVRELETMVTELLESARLNDAQGKLRLEKVDLAQLLKEMVARYEGEAPGILLVPLTGAAFVEVDVQRFVTAVQNVLQNAIKYSGHQKRPVEVSVSHLDQNRIRISVKDFGVGISKEEQSLIFEPFYRVDRSRMKASGGYGLGLALCKKIITAHRGQIQIVSTPGQETVFEIDLPFQYAQ